MGVRVQAEGLETGTWLSWSPFLSANMRSRHKGFGILVPMHVRQSVRLGILGTWSIGQSEIKALKRAHLAFRPLSLWVDWMYARLIWSVHITKGCLDPAASVTSSLEPASLPEVCGCPYCNSFRMKRKRKIRGERKAQDLAYHHLQRALPRPR